MTRYRSILTSSRGYSLLEVLVATTILTIVVPILAMLFTSTNKNFIGFEAANSLKKNNQDSVNRIYLRLGRSKKMFQDDTSGADFLSKIPMTGCPTKMSTTKLPTIETTGSLSPGTTTFDATSFGNSLFFVYNAETASMDNISDSTSTTSTTTVRVDLYRFAYYYLTSDDAPQILGEQSYKLVEWASTLYADCSQLKNIQNSTKLSHTLYTLTARGVPLCWDATATTTSTAFSTFTVTGTDTAKMDTLTSHTIVRYDCKVLTKLITGIMGGGYMYGISPNTKSKSDFRKKVPLFASESGTFPGGFEVGVAGPSAGRKVLVRSVETAKSGINQLVADEEVIVSNIRDVW